MSFNSPLPQMSPAIETEFRKWENLFKDAASELLCLKYMDNRSIDKIHSRNLTIHSFVDTETQLLYMVKLFYKNSNNNEYIYVGFRKRPFSESFIKKLASFDVEEAPFGANEPSFDCIAINDIPESAVKNLIRIYVALSIIEINSN